MVLLADHLRSAYILGYGINRFLQLKENALNKYQRLVEALNAASKTGHAYRVQGGDVQRKLPSWTRWHFVCFAADVVERAGSYIDATDGQAVQS